MTIAARATPAGASPDPARPVEHEAVLHSSPAGLAGLLATRIRSAIVSRHAVVAVLAPGRADALRAQLGAAVGRVQFADPAEVHAVPAFTAAVRLARISRSGRTLVIVEHIPDLPGCEPRHWARFDIALNVAIAGLPITVLCPFAVDDPALSLARTTHPAITDGQGTAASAHYRLPHEVLVDHPPPPPPDLGPPTAALSFGAGDLVALRRLVGGVAVGLAPDRAADLVLAVNELASNSIEHGLGAGRLRIWAGDPLVAEVSDHGGPIDAPFPGLSLPPAAGARGRGLWLASELCDVLQVWSDTGRTVIRVSLDR